MADWTMPALSSTYSLFLQYLKDRDLDSGKMFVNTTGIGVDNIIEFNRAGNKFREWSAANTPTDVVLSIAGGGTGATTVTGIRINLGLGTMATQNSDSVAISGGTISGNGAGLTNLAAGNLANGTVPLARLGSNASGAGVFLRGDNTWQAIPPNAFAPGGYQTAPFNSAIETYYLCGAGATYANLPTLVGNEGKRVVFVNWINSAMTIYPAGGQNILNATSYIFDYGPFSSITCLACSANNQWVII